MYLVLEWELVFIMLKDIILCEDCRETLKRNDLKCDYIITAPPDFSEVGLDPDKKEDLIKYYEFISSVYKYCTDKSNIMTTIMTDRKSGGRIVTKNERTIQIFRSLGYVPISYKIWVKSEVPKIDLYRLNYAHIITFARAKVKVRKNLTREFRYDVFNVNYERVEDFNFGFPKKLVELCISEYTTEGDIVYDPFMGSGTVAVGAKNLGRNYVGSEIVPKVVEIARRRLESM